MAGEPAERGPGALLLALLMIALVAVPGIVMLAAAFDPQITTRVRFLGTWRILPFEEGRWIWGVQGSLLLLLAVWLGLGARRSYSRLPKTEGTQGPDQLRLGEAVRWSGRPGIRALGLGHAFIAFGVLLCALPFVFACYWIWAGPMSAGEGWFVRSVQGFATLVCSLVLGPLAVAPSWTLLMRENRWLHALTGRLLVTDRRLLWCNWRGMVRHEIEGSAIEDVVFVAPTDRNREEIHLRVRTHNARAQDLVLHGLPDASAAAAALMAISRQSGH